MADKTPPANGDNNKNLIGAEFQALPLDYLIGAPLIAAVKAQKLAAESTLDYINGMIENGKPKMVEFSVEQQGPDGAKEVNLKAPLLAITPVPHLRIDALNINFTFEISQTYRNAKETNKGVESTVASGKALSPWVSASIKGSASSKSSAESKTNRSGTLNITVNASEAPIPEGLARVLSFLTSSIQVPDAQ